MVHALLVPTVLHAVYNVVVSIGLGLLSLLLAASFILLLYRRVKRQIALTQRISPFNPRQEDLHLLRFGSIARLALLPRMWKKPSSKLTRG